LLYDEDESEYMETTSTDGASTFSDTLSRDQPVQDEQLVDCNYEASDDIVSDETSTDSESDHNIERRALCERTSSSSSDDEDEEVLIDDDFWEPVYEGANISTVGAYCAIMEFKRACRLSFSTIAMLLQLLQLLCPSNNKLPKSVYYFKKFFQGQSNSFQRRQFCSNCKTEYQDGQKLCNNSECNSLEPDTLITFDYKKAIRRVLKRKSGVNSRCINLKLFVISF